jgi:hypothetical protein
LYSGRRSFSGLAAGWWGQPSLKIAPSLYNVFFILYGLGLLICSNSDLTFEILNLMYSWQKSLGVGGSTRRKSFTDTEQQKYENRYTPSAIATRVPVFS